MSGQNTSLQAATGNKQSRCWLATVLIPAVAGFMRGKQVQQYVAMMKAITMTVKGAMVVGEEGF